MVMTRDLTAKQNQEANSRKRLKTCDNDHDSTSWSHMLGDILISIILNLGVIDFIAFSGVCKSWRTVAHASRKKFMLSRPPMHLSISTQVAKKKQCYLNEFEGRKFKTILPCSSNRTCVGSTCGYLILFGRRTYDFRLVNLITRHELHFPSFPINVGLEPDNLRCALVYSPTTCSWGFVISLRYSKKISFVFSSKLASWTHLRSNLPICDLHSFEGKIYALNTRISLYEVRIGSRPALTQLNFKILANVELKLPEFMTLGGKLCVIGNRVEDQCKTVEVDFDQMKWLRSPNALKEHECFARYLKCGSTKLDFWMDVDKEHKRFSYLYSPDEREYIRVAFSGVWYCPHKCLDVNLLHEWMN